MSLADFEIEEVISTKGKNKSTRILKSQINSNPVCLKTFTSEKFSAVQEALEEAKLLLMASSQHPNICQMYDCFVEYLNESFCFVIVMEHFGNGDLEDEIKRRKRRKVWWTEKELFEIFTSLVDALSVLQKNKICHRDLKPQNLFMEQPGHFKIGDFGVSRKEIEGLPGGKTLVGTPVYFSPSCAKAYLNYELYGLEDQVLHNMYKSDVFSLGLTFLRMASLKNVRGLNMRGQEVISQRVNDLHYSELVKASLHHMLQVEESLRPDFLDLQVIMQELQSPLLPKPLCEYNFKCIESFAAQALEDSYKQVSLDSVRKDTEEYFNENFWELDTLESLQGFESFTHSCGKLNTCSGARTPVLIENTGEELSVDARKIPAGCGADFTDELGHRSQGKLN